MKLEIYGGVAGDVQFNVPGDNLLEVRGTRLQLVRSGCEILDGVFPLPVGSRRSHGSSGNVACGDRNVRHHRSTGIGHRSQNCSCVFLREGRAGCEEKREQQQSAEFVLHLLPPSKIDDSLTALTAGFLEPVSSYELTDKSI